ncbi:MAG: methyltransferase domain-containing protein [Chloroflexi bacterium]|nr:methyltransferase domain-containing protein [Chloroflexota bacterium]
MSIRNSAFQTVAEAYDRNADKYDEFIENNPNLMRMRQRVYQFITARLPKDSRILDLACGTGTDAIWFAQNGYSVFGVDISGEMLERAKEKARGLNLPNRLSFEQLSYTDLKDANIGQFDLTFSNFGGLNCVADMKLVAESARPLLKPNARVIWALMPPFCLWESAMLLRGKFKLATRRFAGKSTVFKEGLNYPVYYYTPKQVAEAWGSGFQLESIEALSVITPPATNKDFAVKRPRLFETLSKLDDVFAPRWPFKYWGDFTIVSLVRK